MRAGVPACLCSWVTGYLQLQQVLLGSSGAASRGHLFLLCAVHSGLCVHPVAPITGACIIVEDSGVGMAF